MADILPFKRPSAQQRNKGRTLCKNGFHKWVAEDGTPFDVTKGKLISRYRCSRCGAIRTRAD